MDVRIVETGELKHLSMVDPDTGVDSVQDFIGNQNALNDGQFEWDDETGEYRATQGTYEWWAELIEKYWAMNEALVEARERHGEEVVEKWLHDSAAWHVDLGDQPDSVMRELEELNASAGGREAENL